MILNDDTVEIEKLDGIRPSTFVVDEFSGLFISLIFSIKYSRTA